MCFTLYNAQVIASTLRVRQKFTIITGEISIILHHAEMCHNKNLEYQNIFSPFPKHKKSVTQNMSWNYIDI